jgi:hypothetical protein
MLMSAAGATTVEYVLCLREGEGGGGFLWFVASFGWLQSDLVASFGWLLPLATGAAGC